ncbi:MAG: AAA family ATPase [Spirochaetaceae bacterium]|nr:AAA family ATPase [Spirochaetaceae bacterium]
MNLKKMTSYFNLTAVPFTKEIPTEKLLRLPSMNRPIQQLSVLAELKGIGLLTGKSGTGKSGILRSFSASLNPGLYKVFYLCHSSVSLIEFYISLCSEMGLIAPARKASMFKVIKERIITLNETDHIHPILIIDEAHMLNNDILKELRLLTNFHIDSVNALSILLCGQESLKAKFGLSILESLANSISVSASMSALPEEETYSYIEERIKHVGGTIGLFTKGAMNLIHQASGGILRSINSLSSAGIMKAFTAGSQSVELEHIQAVIQR